MTNRKHTFPEYQIYDAIYKYTAVKGYALTVREIGSAVGLRSTSTIHQYLNKMR